MSRGSQVPFPFPIPVPAAAGVPTAPGAQEEEEEASAAVASPRGRCDRYGPEPAHGGPYMCVLLLFMSTYVYLMCLCQPAPTLTSH